MQRYPTTHYRPDIDGLRAIAVLSVILFHIDRRILPGGFVGVDVFFVISGFLITRNIVEDLEKGSYSIIDFYRRRVKRIAPMLLSIVFLTVVAAQLLMLPEDANATAKSAVWALSSLANVYFYLNQDSGYFAASSREMPLLHLWSLGIEEQFYILWPLVLMSIFRAIGKKAFFFGALTIAAVSFCLGDLLFRSDPSFVYFMLPTRAGELLLGALAAIVVAKRVECEVCASTVLMIAGIGLFLLLAPLVLLSEDDPFPGLRAVPPTLGTALVILAGHYGQTWISRVLGFGPLVWVGLISYSAYLWHWPLLVFSAMGMERPLLLER